MTSAIQAGSYSASPQNPVLQTPSIAICCSDYQAVYSVGLANGLGNVFSELDAEAVNAKLRNQFVAQENRRKMAIYSLFLRPSANLKS
jgi:hypothetical protein